jgi:hypothetical protein
MNIRALLALTLGLAPLIPAKGPKNDLPQGKGKGSSKGKMTPVAVPESLTPAVPLVSLTGVLFVAWLLRRKHKIHGSEPSR